MNTKKWNWVLLTVVACVSLGLWIGCFRNEISEMEVSVPAMKTRECEAVIRAALTKLEPSGLHSSELRFDLEKRMVWVTYNNARLGRRNIEKAIAHAGFAANDLPADEAARAKLSAACRGE